MMRNLKYQDVLADVELLVRLLAILRPAPARVTARGTRMISMLWIHFLDQILHLHAG